MLHTPDPLVPPTLFRSREFTVTNLATVLLYAAIGVTFFLVSYQLQVGAGWTALQAGTALLPATVLMLLGSARSGALAQRIGPRLQLTLGPLILAAGLLLLVRIGPDPSWGRDVLPGAIVLGVGLVTFVAPLTATVMGSVSPDHVSVASGVNNAIARTASLAALAVIPVVSGLASAVGPAAVTDAFRTATRDLGRDRSRRRADQLRRPQRRTSAPGARRAACTARSTVRRSSPTRNAARSPPAADPPKRENAVMSDSRLEPNVDIVIDCAEPEVLAEFWAAALGYRAVGFGEPYFLLLPTQRAFPPVILQRVPEPKQGKARIHFDLRVSDVDAEVRRLEGLGAHRIDVGQGDEVAWVPMADPEGNEFCVCPGAPLDV